MFWLLGLLYVIWKDLLWSKSKTWNKFRFSHAIPRYTPHTKLPVPGGEFFPDLCCQWEPIQNSQVCRWSVQIYPPPDETASARRVLCWSVLSMRAHLKQSSFQMKFSDIPYHNLSDEVTKIRCEMMYPDRLLDIPPRQNCKCQEESSLMIYVVNESLFETVKFSDEVLRYTPPTICQMKWQRSDVRWHT